MIQITERRQNSHLYFKRAGSRHLFVIVSETFGVSISVGAFRMLNVNAVELFEFIHGL